MRPICSITSRIYPCTAPGGQRAGGGRQSCGQETAHAGIDWRTPPSSLAAGRLAFSQRAWLRAGFTLANPKWAGPEGLLPKSDEDRTPEHDRDLTFPYDGRAHAVEGTAHSWVRLRSPGILLPGNGIFMGIEIGEVLEIRVMYFCCSGCSSTGQRGLPGRHYSSYRPGVPHSCSRLGSQSRSVLLFNPPPRSRCERPTGDLRLMHRLVHVAATRQ